MLKYEQPNEIQVEVTSGMFFLCVGLLGEEGRGKTGGRMYIVLGNEYLNQT